MPRSVETGPKDLAAYLKGFLSDSPFEGFWNCAVPHVNRSYEARAFGLVSEDGKVLIVTVARGKIVDAQ